MFRFGVVRNWHPDALRWLFVLGYMGAVASLAGIYLARNLGYAVDDSFITYRYAYHLKEGFGLVFNVGEAYYGTTAAGYAVVLAFISALGSSIEGVLDRGLDQLFLIENVSTSMAAASLAGVAMLAFLAVGRHWRRWPLALGAAAILFSLHGFNEVAGHETYPFLGVAFLGTVLVGHFRAYRSGGAVLAVAATFRPDALVLAVLVPVLDWVRSGVGIRDYVRSAEFRGFVAAYAVVAISWLAFLSYHFGTPLPGTMAAKKAQVAMGHWPSYSPSTLYRYVNSEIGHTGIWLAAIGIGAVIAEAGVRMLRILRLVGVAEDGQGAAVARDQTAAVSWIVIAGVWIGYAALTVAAYLSFRVTFWNWYGIPVVFSLLVSALIGWIRIDQWVESAARLLLPATPRLVKVVSMFPILVLGLLLAGKLPEMRAWATTSNVNAHISSYSEIVEYIHQESPDGAIIQIAEPGSFGYHLGPKYFVVDELGLVSPGVAQALMRRDYAWTINTWKPDYLVCSWPGEYSACSHGLEAGRYELIGEFNREFWYPHLRRGASLFRKVTDGSVRAMERPAVERISRLHLGDRWGKVEKGPGPRELFVHPGATTTTSFVVSSPKNSGSWSLWAQIAALPKEATSGSGSVGVEVLTIEGGVLLKRFVVDQQHALARRSIGEVPGGQIRIVVDNNGDPSFDWLIIGVTDN